MLTRTRARTHAEHRPSVNEQPQYDVIILQIDIEMVAVIFFVNFWIESEYRSSRPRKLMLNKSSISRKVTPAV